jgi:hypothetical protein
MNQVTKWVSDEVCLENSYYQKEFLYPSEAGQALLDEARKSSENRKHWVLIPSFDREFTYKIYNHGTKGYLNGNFTEKSHHRHALVNSEHSQLWKLNYSTDDEIEIENVDLNEKLYAYGDYEIKEVFTGKKFLNLAERAVWKVSYHCN